MTERSRSKILWVDDDLRILSTAKRLLRKDEWEVLTTSSVSEAERWVSEQNVSVVIADQRMPEMTGTDFLQFCLEKSPQTTRILLTGFLEGDVIEKAANQAQIFKFMTKPWDEDELVLDVEKAIEYSDSLFLQKKLIKQKTTQNKKLEVLTGDLEAVVQERTEDIEKSKNQVERNLSKMRKLVLFIKELSSLRGLEELLIFLKKEIRKFHHVGNPVLVYLTHDGQKKVLYFRRSEVIEKTTENDWLSGGKLRFNEKEDQEYLAKVFTRPVTKVLAMPLERKGFPNGATLYIEHDLSEEELNDFGEFMGQRAQPLSLAIDRILLEYQATFVSMQWESTFDGILRPIAILDSDYNLLRSNRSFTQGRQSQKCYLRFSGEKEKCRGCPVDKAIETGEPQSSTIHVSGRIYNVYAYPIHVDEDQKVTHVVNDYFDITDSRKLYGRVVQNEKLGAIGLLAGNIAHELNNPLTGIHSLAQVLRAELQCESEEQMNEDLQEIETAAKRCQQIIKNLLEFSEPEESEELTKVSLKNLIEKTLPLLKTALRNHNSQIELEESTYVRAKAPLLQQVFFNLVNNACQAMTEVGTVKVRTSFLEKEQKKWVILKVEDEGPGIPEELQEKIFEPFFTTKKEGEGTGLGLSMSQAIIERFGGRIEVNSEVGKGTCFSVVLPEEEGM